MIFGAIQRRSVRFRVDVEYAASLWHLYCTRRSLDTPVSSSRHWIDWHLLQELNLLTMVINYSLYKRFKVQWIIAASNGNLEPSPVGHTSIVVNRTTDLFQSGS